MRGGVHRRVRSRGRQRAGRAMLAERLRRSRYYGSQTDRRTCVSQVQLPFVAAQSRPRRCVGVGEQDIAGSFRRNRAAFRRGPRRHCRRRPGRGNQFYDLVGDPKWSHGLGRRCARRGPNCLPRAAGTYAVAKNALRRPGSGTSICRSRKASRSRRRSGSSSGRCSTSSMHAPRRGHEPTLADFRVHCRGWGTERCSSAAYAFDNIRLQPAIDADPPRSRLSGNRLRSRPSAVTILSRPSSRQPPPLNLVRV